MISFFFFFVFIDYIKCMRTRCNVIDNVDECGFVQSFKTQFFCYFRRMSVPLTPYMLSYSDRLTRTGAAWHALDGWCTPASFRAQKSKWSWLKSTTVHIWGDFQAADLCSQTIDLECWKYSLYSLEVASVSLFLKIMAAVGGRARKLGPKKSLAPGFGVLLKHDASGSTEIIYDLITLGNMRLTCRAWHEALPLGEELLNHPRRLFFAKRVWV